MQMVMRIQLDIFGFTDVRSVVIEIKLQQTNTIKPTFHKGKENK